MRGVTPAVAVALLLGGCLPAGVTDEASQVQTLYLIFMAAAAVVAAIVLGLTTFAILRYRGRKDVLPAQTRGNVRLEIVWTALPALTVAVLFGLTFLTMLQIDADDEQPGATEIVVIAYRWGWQFGYPEADVIVRGIGVPGPEVVVPVGEPVRFRISAADVIHSFYVPQFLVKRDANPGRENLLEVTVQEPGTYRGQCAEYCGLYHARMPFSVRAVPRAEFDAWLAAQPRGSQPPASVPIGGPVVSQPGATPTASESGTPLDEP